MKRKAEQTNQSMVSISMSPQNWNDPDRIKIQTNFAHEHRNALIGKIGAKLWTVIFTQRVAAIRIISVRRARKKEAKLYENK